MDRVYLGVTQKFFKKRRVLARRNHTVFRQMGKLKLSIQLHRARTIRFLVTPNYKCTSCLTTIQREGIAIFQFERFYTSYKDIYRAIF